MRIGKLESTLLIPYKIDWAKKSKMSKPEVVLLSPELEHELFDKNLDHLVEIYYQKFKFHYFFVMEDYLRKACKRYKPLLYVLCANGALFVEHTPPFVRNRVELANIYWEKSANYSFIKDRSPDAALALCHLAMTCFRIQSLI